MKVSQVKKRLKKLSKYAEQNKPDIICFVFKNEKGTWYAEWNDGESQQRKDGFQSVDEALEFAESLNNVSDIFYHHRETNDIIIVDEWSGDSGAG